MSSGLRPLLEQRKLELQREIAAAAASGDDDLLLARTDDFRAVASALTRFTDADREAASLLKILTSGGTLPASPLPSRPSPGGRSSRELGTRIRADFIARAAQAGLALKNDRGSIYRTPSGRRVGTAVATERHKNRWFLGLGEDSFDAAALLCVPDQGSVLAICLPQAFFATHGKYLSRSGGQVKFNVARRGADLIVKIPGMSPERVNEYVDLFLGLSA